MSSDENKYGLGHLIGDANLLRNANPTIRGAIRRVDPDANPAPHFTGLNGTILNIDYSPTGAQAINFTSDDLDVAITTINALDASNLQAIDDDGYLRLLNLNGGSKNHLKIMSGTAASILGFVTNPLPGSASFAGEIATAPPGRQQAQNNPHGTALLAGDEDLQSSSINRAVIGSLLHAERLAADFDLETLAIQEVAVTIQAHPISGERVFRIQDSTLRIPIRGFGIAVSNPASGLLDSQFQLLEVSGGVTQEYIDLTNASWYGRVVNVYYDDLTNTLDDTASFAVWGTPDGKSIFNKAATDDKHAATSITLVDGDILSVTGATFQALDCAPGDTALIAAATNNDPFNHNGEFVIIEVLSETQIRVRPKSPFDRTFSSSDTPRSLNSSLPGGTNYGTVKVLIGDLISASDLVFEVAPTDAPASSAIRMLVGRRAQATRVPLADAGLAALTKNNVRISELLRIHAVTAASLRHPSNHIDAPAVAGSPDSLTLGTVEEQLAEILAHLNALIAGQVTYAGGSAWADGSTNPSTTLENQVDKMILDLAGIAGGANSGVGKIGVAEAVADWVDGNGPFPAETLWLRLERIVGNLGAGLLANQGAKRVGIAQQDATLHDGSVLGSDGNSVWTRFEQIVEFLAVTTNPTSSGAFKIGVAASALTWNDGHQSAAGSVQSRIDEIIVDLVANEGADRLGVVAPVFSVLWDDADSIQVALNSLAQQSENHENEFTAAEVRNLSLGSVKSIDLSSNSIPNASAVNAWSYVIGLAANNLDTMGTWRAVNNSQVLEIPIELTDLDKIVGYWVLGAGTTAEISAHIISIQISDGVRAILAGTGSSGDMTTDVSTTATKVTGLSLPLIPNTHRYAIEVWTGSGAGQRYVAHVVLTTNRLKETP